MKKAWEGMNNIMNRKTKKLNYIHAIKDYNNGNRLVRNLSCIPNILNKCPRESFCFNLITPTEVKLEILALPIHKAHGLYSCPSQKLKLLAILLVTYCIDCSIYQLS